MGCYALKGAGDKDTGGKVSDESAKKPEFKTVYDYATKSVEHYIRKYASHLPLEQKQEIAQDAALRAWESYQNLDASKGWKSYIQLHCRGAVLDYLKGGNGNIEDGLVSDPDKDGLKTRVEVRSEKEEGGILSVEETAAMFGIHSLGEAGEQLFSPNWDLLSRMSGKDENLAIVAKVLAGFTQDQISLQLGMALGFSISRERISQRMYEFFEELDAPENIGGRWISQCIFALGLCSYYHMKEDDNGLGWDLEAFDLQDPESFLKARRHYTPTFFDIMDEN